MKNNFGFSYTFCWNILLSTNFEIMRSDEKSWTVLLVAIKLRAIKATSNSHLLCFLYTQKLKMNCFSTVYKGQKPVCTTLSSLLAAESDVDYWDWNQLSQSVCSNERTNLLKLMRMNELKCLLETVVRFLREMMRNSFRTHHTTWDNITVL